MKAKTDNKKLFVVDQRMLDLKDYCVARKLASSQRDWCRKIGFEQTNIAKIKSGQYSFTNRQILAAAELSNVDINWIFGRTDTMRFFKDENKERVLLKLSQTKQEPKKAPQTKTQTKTAKKAEKRNTGVPFNP